MADTSLNIISSDANSVSVTSQNSSVTINTNGVTNDITIPASEISTVRIVTVGPPGPTGPPGSSGGAGSGFPFSGSGVISGSLLISGSGLIVTGSIFVTNGFTGSLFGTASWATNFVSASYYVLNNQTSSFITSGSIGITQTISGSLAISQNLTMLGTSSIIYGTASNSLTASYITPLSQSVIITGSITLAGGSRLTNQYDYSSIDIQAGPGGYVELLSNNTQTSIWVTDENANIITSAGDYYWGFNKDGTTTIPGGVNISGSQTITGSLSVTTGITGSLFGTASWARNFVSASYYVLNNQTSSFVQNSQTSSFLLNSVTSSMLSLYVQNSYTSSVNTSISNLNTTTASLNTSISNLNTTTASLNTSISNLNTFTASVIVNYVANTQTGSFVTNSKTGSFITIGSSGITQTISGSLVISQNLTVLGSSSIVYVTSSQLNISTNIITVNTSTPAIRFGGLAVYDSGSTGKTGSILWDSQNDQWIYSNPSGALYDGALFLVGPRNNTGMGNESPINIGYAAVGDGGHHMTSSLIYNSGSLIRLETNTQITGSLNVSNGITGSLQSLKAASGSVASFSGTPRISSVTFTSTFANNLYAVNVIGEDARMWTIESKTSAGFTINSNSSVALTGPVYWIATSYN